MANVRTSTEGARGCGYRKGGGLYLVSGRLSEPCPLLPIALDVCPTCHAGIKPTRSWTWVDGVAITHVTEHGTLEHRAVCVLQPGNVERLRRAGLIWIGERYYKTADDFTVEASRMGVSRRIPAVPRDFELGTTWVLLAHRKAVANPLYEHEAGPADADGHCTYVLANDQVCGLTIENAAHIERTTGIFTTFMPTAVEYVVKGDETPEELDALEKRGLSLVKVIRAEDAAGVPVTVPDDRDDELQEPEVP